MRKYREYSDQDVINAASKVSSMSQLLKALNLKMAGGNYANMRRKLQTLNVNCDHWTGQGWSKDKRLKDWSQYSRGSKLKSHLIKERGHVCEKCHLKEWLGIQIALEVHHKDGDRTNNHESNLELCCPNCHAQTDNYRGRNKSLKK